MDTIIKQFKPGDILELPAFKTIRIMEIWSYDQVFDYDIKDQRALLNEQLRKQLGSDYRDLYYQAFCEVVKCTKKSRFKKGQKLVLDWSQLQKYSVIKL